MPGLDIINITDTKCLTTKEYVDLNAGGGSIDDLSDVDTTTTTPAADDYLKWDGTNWVPAAPQTIVLDDISDVDTTTAAPTNGQVLAWDGTNWVPGNNIVTYEKFDFDATVGQTDFIILGQVLTLVEVLSNGIDVRDTNFSVSDDGTDTTIILSTAATAGDWIKVRKV